MMRMMVGEVWKILEFLSLFYLLFCYICLFLIGISGNFFKSRFVDLFLKLFKKEMLGYLFFCFVLGEIVLGESRGGDL